MPDSYYDPPEPPDPCCSEYEDDPDHDWEDCMATQAEDAAEAKAERIREDMMDAEYFNDREEW